MKVYCKFITQGQSTTQKTTITLCTLSKHPIESNGHLTVSKEPQKHAI